MIDWPTILKNRKAMMIVGITRFDPFSELYTVYSVGT